MQRKSALAGTDAQRVRAAEDVSAPRTRLKGAARRRPTDAVLVRRLIASRALRSIIAAGMKTPASAGGVDKLVGWIKRALLTILLNTGRAQTGKAVLVDRILPREKFLDRERVTAARLLKRKKSAAARGDDFRLAANHPTLRSRRRQIGDRQRGTVRPDDVLDPRAVGLSHSNSHVLDTTGLDLTHGRLKICLSAKVDWRLLPTRTVRGLPPWRWRCAIRRSSGRKPSGRVARAVPG